MPQPAAPLADADAAFDPSTLQTAADVAHWLELPLGGLIHLLYEAPDLARYRTFVIPKRSGGVRQISAPIGELRAAQYKLLAVFQRIYDAHPAAHGFIPGRSVVTNAREHVGQRLVLNIDLKDFFPSINFGRVRGLLMKPPFGMGAKAATVVAQICIWRNGLPQGAPTSPVLSNFIATALDRRLLRLARENRLRYSRYADDITFSTTQAVFPSDLAVHELDGEAMMTVRAGPKLVAAVTACGFVINPQKVRLQGRAVRQSVTGITVNTRPNLPRERIRHLRAMLHAWGKFGLEAAGAAHFERRKGRVQGKIPVSPGKAFRNIVYGHVAYLKMVRGKDDPLFLKNCSRLITLDPNPSRFVREMAFGAADFDVFISHASEDKAAIARPIYEACRRLGVKAFLDEEHIAWGQSFTSKINTALGAARTVLCIVTPTSVGKEWPLTEVNSALALEVEGEKDVVVLRVGNPDLTRLPLIKTKKHLAWADDPDSVARHVKAVVGARRKQAAAAEQASTSVPVVAARSAVKPEQPAKARATAASAGPPATARRGFLARLFGR